MRDEKEERKKQARSSKQTRQSNTAHPRQSLFRAASGGTRILYTLDRALYQLSYRGSSAGWAQISHLIVHLMHVHSLLRGNAKTDNCPWDRTQDISINILTAELRLLSRSLHFLITSPCWTLTRITATCALY